MSTSDCSKRLVRSRSGLRFVNVDEGNCSPFELTEPFWKRDTETPTCMECDARFDFFIRRHHCRRCGNIYCSNCCDKKIPLLRMCFVDPVRVCSSCVEVTEVENNFYDKHLKALLSGANFCVNESSNTETAISFRCHLSSNHRLIVFDGGSDWQQCPVPLMSVISLKMQGTMGSPGLSQVSGAVLVYLDSKQQNKELPISVASVPNRKQSVFWLVSLQKALKFIKNSPESPDYPPD